jgi:signal transduction histidine kinase/PAS domain-containing protein
MAALVPSSLLPILAGYLLSGATMLALAVYTLRNRELTGTLRSFTLLLVGITLWSWAAAGRMLTASLESTLLFHHVGYVGVVVAPLTWLLFALFYTGKGHYVTKRTVAGLSVLPLGTLVLVGTNYRDLFYRSVGTVPVGDVSLIALEAGPMFWVWTAYGYLLFVVGFVVLVRFARTSSSLYRTQSTALTLAGVPPIAVNAIYVAGRWPAPNVDPTPITFALSGLLVAIAVFYGQFVHLVPVARDAIVETIDDGIVVVDDGGTVVHVNPAAESLLPAAGDSRVIGRDADAVLPWDVDAVAGTGAGREVEVDAADGTAWHWVREIELDRRQSITGDVYILTDITERKQLERRLRALQKTHQELMTAETIPEIGDIVVSAAREILDLPVTALWRFDEQSGVLEPVAITPEGAETVGPAPTFEPGNSLAWETFEAGRLRVFDDVTDHAETYRTDTPIRSEIQVPVGDRGLIVTGATEGREFEDVTLELVRILATATERAFVQTERELQLRDRERQLARENERLDEFTSVVAHDLRSPLNSAGILLDRVTDEYDDDRIEKIAAAHARTRDLVDDLLALARQGKTVEQRTPVAVGTVAERAWGSVATSDGTLELAQDCPTLPADQSRLRQIFENLFRNAVEHGSTNPSSQARQDAVEHGSTSPGSQARRATPEQGSSGVTVRVGPLDDGEGFYVADDGPGISASERPQVFDHGYTQSDDGTGFGLAIVRRIVEAHGWTVEATESRDGGLRIEVSGVTTTDEPGSRDADLAQ